MCVTFLGIISLRFSFWFIRNAGFESTTMLRFSTAFIMILKTVKLQRERPLKQQNCEMNVGILLPRVTAGIPFKSRGCRKEFEESFISNPNPLRAFNKKNALAYPWLTHFNALFVITKSCIDQQLQSMTYVSFFQTCGESIRAAFSHSKKLIGQFYSCLWNYVFLGVAFEMSVFL